MANNIITKEDLKPLLDLIGEEVCQMQRDRFKRQQEVHGSYFPKLKESTVRKKKSMGGGIASNANKRMIATGDFRNNAFIYKTGDDGVTITVSKSNHRGANNSKPHTYLDIAGWQMRGEYEKGSFPKGGRNTSVNEGADFFGMSKRASDELTKKYKKSFADLYLRKVDEFLNKVVNNAR